MAVASLVLDDRREEGLRSSQTAEESFLLSAVERGQGGNCPNCKGFFLVSASTGRACEMSCKSWSCPVCSRRRRAVAVELIAGGLTRARSRGERVRFATLTAPSRGMSLSELYSAWNRLRTALRKSGELAEYCAVVELGGAQRPEPHLHALTTGRYVPQRRLSVLADRAGFGRVADIRAVREAAQPAAVAYLSKQLTDRLTGYLVKAEVARLAERADSERLIGKRAQVRPLRLSRNWYSGGFKAAERAVAERLARLAAREDRPSDPGPWYVVLRRWDGGLSIVSRPKAGDQAA